MLAVPIVFVPIQQMTGFGIPREFSVTTDNEGLFYSEAVVSGSQSCTVL